LHVTQNEDTVWIPELMKHTNARNVSGKRDRFIRAREDAAHLARMIDREVKSEPDGAVAVPSGSDRADFIFLTKDQLAGAILSLAGRLPERGGAGLVRRIRSCRREEGGRQFRCRQWRRRCVAPAAANGTLLAFVKA